MLIRDVKTTDAKQILDIYSNYVLNTAVSFEIEVPTEAEFIERIKKISSEYPYLIAEIDGVIAGYCYASSFHSRQAYKHCVETSIYIRKDCHGQGIGKALYNQLEKKLLTQNVFTLYACISTTDRINDTFLTNDSFLFHTKMGYKLIGNHELCGFKFNKWYSICWMEKRIAQITAQPQPFIPYIKIKNENN